MKDSLHSVGETARASGLPASALRFYATNGVLVPARVDPRTGYRWYTADQVTTARLLQALRDAGVSLADIKRIATGERDDEQIRQILNSHLERMKSGLAELRRAVARAGALLDAELPGTPTLLQVTGAELARAAMATGFAVAGDSDGSGGSSGAGGEPGGGSVMPALHGILVEVRDGMLTLAATDRYRLAIGQLRAEDITGPSASVLVSAALIRRAARVYARRPAVDVRIDHRGLTMQAGGRRLSGPVLCGDFPEYRGLLPEPARYRARAEVATLCHALTAAPVRRVVRDQDGQAREVSVLMIRQDASLAVADPAAASHRAGREAEHGAGHRALHASDLRIGVDRHFLLQALSALGCERFTLAVDGPRAPIALRPLTGDWAMSLTMPVGL